MWYMTSENNCVVGYMIVSGFTVCENRSVNQPRAQQKCCCYCSERHFLSRLPTTLICGLYSTIFCVVPQFLNSWHISSEFAFFFPFAKFRFICTKMFVNFFHLHIQIPGFVHSSGRKHVTWEQTPSGFNENTLTRWLDCHGFRLLLWLLIIYCTLSQNVVQMQSSEHLEAPFPYKSSVNVIY